MIYLGPPVSKDASLDDLVPLLRTILQKVEDQAAGTTICNKCGCMRFPDDVTCPGCRAHLIMVQ